VRKVGDRLQHYLYSDIQIIIVMKLIYFENCKVRFQIVRVLLGLYFHVVFKCRQMLGIVSKSEQLSARTNRKYADLTISSNDYTFRCLAKATQPFVSLPRPWLVKLSTSKEFISKRNTQKSDISIYMHRHTDKGYRMKP